MVHQYGPLVKWPKTPASHAGNTSSNLVRVTIVGADGGGGTPVPIPNTAVKPTCVEDTWLEAARENRQTPTLQAPDVVLLPGLVSYAEEKGRKVA